MQSLTMRMLQDGWYVDAIDTARHVDYLSIEEKDVFLATNALRTDPGRFAELYVAEMLKRYEGELLTFPNEIPIRTFEGAAAANVLYAYLLNQPSVNPLYPSRGMSRAAADHAYDQSISGRTSHTGQDGADPFARLNRYGRWGITAAENIAYGKNDGLRIVLQLAVDDGVVTRGHRSNLLNADYTVSGVGINTHPEFGHSCTIEYAGQYTEMNG